jgi:hypothetical protein
MGPYAGADFNLTLSDTSEVQFSTPTMTNAIEFFSQLSATMGESGRGRDTVSSWQKVLQKNSNVANEKM